MLRFSSKPSNLLSKPISNSSFAYICIVAPILYGFIIHRVSLREWRSKRKFQLEKKRSKNWTTMMIKESTLRRDVNVSVNTMILQKGSRGCTTINFEKLRPLSRRRQLPDFVLLVLLLALILLDTSLSSSLVVMGHTLTSDDDTNNLSSNIGMFGHSRRQRVGFLQQQQQQQLRGGLVKVKTKTKTTAEINNSSLATAAQNDGKVHIEHSSETMIQKRRKIVEQEQGQLEETKNGIEPDPKQHYTYGDVKERTQMKMNRIVNGQDVQPSNRYPWFVRLLGSSEDAAATHACGGVLIAPDLILTAAHCPDPRRAYVGLSNLDLNSTGIYNNGVDVLKNVRHPEYNGTSNSSSVEYDIMLSQLATDTSVTAVTPIRMNFDDDYPPSDNSSDDELTMLGFGSTSSSTILQTASTNYVPFDVCAVAKDPITGVVYGINGAQTSVQPYEFCTLDNATSTCIGDSGGPIIKEEYFNDETALDGQGDLLVAMISSGTSDKCGTNSYLPLLNQRVSYYKEWILQTGCELLSSSPTNTPNEWNCTKDGNGNVNVPHDNSVYSIADDQLLLSDGTVTTNSTSTGGGSNDNDNDNNSTDLSDDNDDDNYVDISVIETLDPPSVAEVTTAGGDDDNDDNNSNTTTTKTSPMTVEPSIPAQAMTSTTTTTTTPSPIDESTTTDGPSSVDLSMDSTATPTTASPTTSALTTLALTDSPKNLSLTTSTSAPTVTITDSPTTQEPRTSEPTLPPTTKPSSLPPTKVPTESPTTKEPTPIPTRQPTSKPNQFEIPASTSSSASDEGTNDNPSISSTVTVSPQDTEDGKNNADHEDGNIYVCLICGDDDDYDDDDNSNIKMISNFDAIVYIPVLGQKTCQELETAAQKGKLEKGSECASIQLVVPSVCECISSQELIIINMPPPQPTIDSMPPSLTPTKSPTKTSKPTVPAMPSWKPTVSPQNRPPKVPACDPDTKKYYTSDNKGDDEVDVTINFYFDDSSAPTIGWYVADPNEECFRIGTPFGNYYGRTKEETLSLKKNVEYKFVLQVKSTTTANNDSQDDDDDDDNVKRAPISVQFPETTSDEPSGSYNITGDGYLLVSEEGIFNDGEMVTFVTPQ